MATFSKCWADLKSKGYQHAKDFGEVLTDKDKQSILDRAKTSKEEDGLSHAEAIRESIQFHHDEAHAQVQSIYDQLGIKTPEAAPAPQTEIPAAPSPKEEAPTEPIAEQPNTIPTPAETQALNGGEDSVGIAERYREEQQPGSVIPGVGKTADEARAWGQDYINKGGNPYDAISNKGPKRELWQDVGIVRAEYERLSNEKRVAESALDANPNDAQAKMAFDNADLAQRKFSKDSQPVLTRAGDALRAASRSYPREINSFSDFTDIVNDHFKGEVELTPEKRAELQKAVKAIKKGNVEATEARAKVTDEAVKKANGKVMDFDTLKSDLNTQMTKLMEDCVL